MARSSRGKRRGSVRAARRGRSSTGWYALSALILVVGIGLILVSRNPESASGAPKANFDHWHAAFGVNVCGTFLPNEQTFEDAEGLHTHGDGLMHIHPFLQRAAGKNATVGLYLEVGERTYKASKTSFKVWDGKTHETGDKCGDKKAEVRWALNGKEQTGDISDYNMQDGDRITLALLPKDEKIPDPPSTPELAAPSDLEPTTGAITVPSTAAVVPGDTSATTAVPTTSGGTTATSVP